MNHVILAKFKHEYSKDKIAGMLPDIKAIFDSAKTISGIHNVVYHVNCIDRPNRYDICISIDMEKDALTKWDSCEWHAIWKEKYGSMLESKCIFDYEE